MYEKVDLNGYIGFVYALLFFYCVAIVIYYAEPGFPWHTYGSLVVGYYCSFGILLLVPIDIASCVIDRRAESAAGLQSYNDNISVLSAAYNVFFTMILILGTFILAYEEYYNTDGKLLNVCMSFNDETFHTV
jgi:ABC-type transport system involved in cytochrome c biogenesis permease subunit